jgi:hypothetical protein
MAVEPHLRAGLAGDDAEAIMLDFVQPLAAGRQLIGFGGEARRDEPGRQDTLKSAHFLLRVLPVMARGRGGSLWQVPAAGSSPRRSGRFTYPRSNANVLDMAPGLRELIALSLLAGLGCGVALAHGDLIFVAIFACAIAMTTNETMRRLR